MARVTSSLDRWWSAEPPLRVAGRPRLGSSSSRPRQLELHRLWCRMPSPIQQERGSSPAAAAALGEPTTRAVLGRSRCIATRRRTRQSHGYSGHVRPTRAERTISRISQHRTFALSVAMCGQRLPGRKHLDVFFGVLPTVAASHETSHGLARVDPDGLSRAGHKTWTDLHVSGLASPCTSGSRLLILRCWVRAPDGPPVCPVQGLFSVG